MHLSISETLFLHELLGDGDDLYPVGVKLKLLAYSY
jgi:hypothetical protein